MKILFITDLYPIKADEFATPKTLHNFVIEWIKLGHTVDVIKPNFIFNSYLRKKPFYNTGFYEYEGVKIFNVNYFTPFLFNIEKKLSNNINIANYDIIVAHMPSGIIFSNKLANKFKKPLVCGVHSSDLVVLTSPLYSIYFKTKLIKAYNNSIKIACRSSVLRNRFVEIFPQFSPKTFIAPSGIDSDFSVKTTIKKEFSRNRIFKILTCANLKKRKNIDKLINAVKDIDNVELIIIGDGKEFKHLYNIANSNNRITFLGRLSNNRVLEEMKSSDIFILPSINETFGMVYLEALASGCITVCTKNDGIDGIIMDSKNGFLTEPTIEGIKTTILKIQSCKNLDKIREEGLETAKLYSLKKCAENYLNNIFSSNA